MSTKSTGAKSANKATTSNNAKKATKKATAAAKVEKVEKVEKAEKQVLTAATFAALVEKNGGTLSAIISEVENFTLEMNPETLKAVISGLLNESASMTAIKAAQKALNAFTGGRFNDIKKAIQKARIEAVNNDLQACKDTTLSYDHLLSLAFSDLSKRPEFAALCTYAQSTFASAADLVRSYYPSVEAGTGAPLTLATLIDEGRTYIASYYTVKVLTPTTAISVLVASLNNLAKCGKARLNDAGWKWQNEHTAGTLCGIWTAKTNEDGTMAKGERLAAIDAVPDSLDEATKAGFMALSEMNKTIRDNK